MLPALDAGRAITGNRETSIATQPQDELAKQPREYLYDEFERRLQRGPVVFRLELELGQEGDPVDDPSAIWPHGRERVVVGQLELLRPITEAETGDPEMMHDPTAVTDGIEVDWSDPNRVIMTTTDSILW